MSIMERARGLVDRALAGARPYRFEGERDSHADQLRETTVSLSLMENADAADPDQVRMASDIEHGAENRLAVLLGRPRLTLEEKRERDAIQAAISARRQSFDGNVLVQREDAPTGIKGFLGPLAAHPAMAILLSPWTWLVAVAAFALLQMGLKERIENQRDEAREQAQSLEASRDAYAIELARERAANAQSMAQVLEDTAETVEQLQRQRARDLARQRREASRHEDLANGSVNFTERLRELTRPEGERLPAISAPASSGDPASALPTESGADANNGANP